MRFSEFTDLLDEAMSAALGDMPNILKANQATVTAKEDRNKFLYSYDYAGLDDVLSAVRPVLSAHKIAVYQGTKVNDNGVILTTRLSHGGQWVESDYPVCGLAAQHQIMGSALTYARRYCLMMTVQTFGTDEDDGGRNAEDAPAYQVKAPREERAIPDQPISQAQRPSAHQAKKDGTWDFLMEQMRLQKTEEEIRAWAKLPSTKAATDRLPPSWVAELREEFSKAIDAARLRVETEKAERDADRMDPRTLETPF